MDCDLPEVSKDPTEFFIRIVRCKVSSQDSALFNKVAGMLEGLVPPMNVKVIDLEKNCDAASLKVIIIISLRMNFDNSIFYNIYLGAILRLWICGSKLFLSVYQKMIKLTGKTGTFFYCVPILLYLALFTLALENSPLIVRVQKLR